MKLSDQELNTVLAALRLWQMQRERDIPGSILEIATAGDTVDPLDSDEIDSLCERLNVDEDALRTELAELEAAFERAGGRGIDLAERIDEIREILGE